MYKETSSKKISTLEGIKIGAIGGAIAAAVMLPFMIGVNLETNSPNIFNFQIVYAILLDSDLTVATYIGMGLHFVAGTSIGMIFGAIMVNKRFFPKSISNGICWGIVAGAISFAVLFIPTMSSKAMVLMTHLEVPTMSEQIIEQSIQSSTALIINSSMLDHVLYGAALGAVVAVYLKKKQSLQIER